MSDFVARASKEKERFVEALGDAVAVQREVLLRYVRNAADTAFGREHGFTTIRDVESFKQRVPIRSYLELKPWIDRVVAGEQRVLSEAPPVLFLATTGTTGEPKTLPVTREYFRNSVNTMLVYWASKLEHYPDLAKRDDTMVMLYMAPKPFSTFTPGGVPIHNPTHLPADVKSGFPFARAPWFPPPSDMSDAERLYYLVRKSAAHDVLGLSCLHPSRLQSLVSLLEQQGPRLVKELHDGTVCGTPNGPANPERARELGALMEASALSPRNVWPNLRFVSCWTGGSFSLFLPDIQARFGCEIFPQTSSSSEAGHITVPLDREPLDGPLTVRNNYYEFRPADAAPEAATLGCEELELDGVYEIVITTCNGLYRYAGGDLFRVIGFRHGVPRLQFVGRRGVSDMTGEKVTEQHVLDAIRSGLTGCGLEAPNATCFAIWGNPSHYLFVFETAQDWSPEAMATLAQRIDEDLVRQNSRYELKRGFGDLGPASVKLLRPGTFARYRQALIDRGMSATQLKDKVLHLDGAVLEELERLEP
jgi:hypothetical protein